MSSVEITSNRKLIMRASVFIIFLFLGIAVFMLAIAPLFWHFDPNIGFTWDKFFFLAPKYLTVFAVMGLSVVAFIQFNFRTSQRERIRILNKGIVHIKGDSIRSEIPWEALTEISEYKNGLIILSNAEKPIQIWFVQENDIKVLQDAWESSTNTPRLTSCGKPTP